MSVHGTPQRWRDGPGLPESWGSPRLSAQSDRPRSDASVRKRTREPSSRPAPDESLLGRYPHSVAVCRDPDEYLTAMREGDGELCVWLADDGEPVVVQYDEDGWALYTSDAADTRHVTLDADALRAMLRTTRPVLVTRREAGRLLAGSAGRPAASASGATAADPVPASDGDEPDCVSRSPDWTRLAADGGARQ